MRPLLTTLAAITVAMTLDARAHADCSLTTQIIPLPVWSTDPNEGNTWGAMPVFLRICPDQHVTRWILAPSVTWNSVIHFTGTVRWYDYPDPDTALSVIASVSTKTAYNFLGIWSHLPVGRGAWTDEAIVRVERNPFLQFFGIGPKSPQRAISSFTGTHILGSERRGLNLTRHVNLGVTVGAERDGVDPIGVPGLPLTPVVFPDTPGMGGATVISQGLDLRYDDRVGLDYADSGTRLEGWANVVEGLHGSPNFLRVGAQASTIVRELDWLATTARVYWNGVSNAQVPFSQQSTLGGSFLLRGFDTGRFVDRQAWTAEVEERIRLFQTNWFGVVSDWRVDPFIATGQVFGAFDSALSSPRVAVGVGLRAFVRPKLVGRIDLADGGEGLKVYVEIGYPY